MSIEKSPIAFTVTATTARVFNAFVKASTILSLLDGSKLLKLFELIFKIEFPIIWFNSSPVSVSLSNVIFLSVCVCLFSISGNCVASSSDSLSLLLSLLSVGVFKNNVSIHHLPLYFFFSLFFTKIIISSN